MSVSVPPEQMAYEGVVYVPLSKYDALAERATAAEAEVEALKHDIERHIGIASSEAEYADRLHKALREFAINETDPYGGRRCWQCNDATWEEGEPEEHAEWCLARPVAPPTEGA